MSSYTELRIYINVQSGLEVLLYFQGKQDVWIGKSSSVRILDDKEKYAHDTVGSVKTVFCSYKA